jgi:UDP-N-acetylglucosamine 2-epimerase
MSDFSPELKSATEHWLSYKKERRENYKPAGLNSLISQIRKAAAEYGDSAVIEVIATSEASNYQGIVFDRLKRQPAAQAKPWSAAAYKGNIDSKTVDMDKLKSLEKLMGGG